MAEMKKIKLSLGMRAALLAVERSTCKVKVGASLVISNQVILACNQDKGSARAARWYRYPENNTHAEWNLFSHTDDNTKVKGVVYVARKLANGEFGLSRPCLSCRQFLKSIGIKRVFFTGYNYDIREEKL